MKPHTLPFCLIMMDRAAALANRDDPLTIPVPNQDLCFDTRKLEGKETPKSTPRKPSRGNLDELTESLTQSSNQLEHDDLEFLKARGPQ